jgi:hypothetical protein
MEIIVKKGYAHYNRALGKYIHNRREYFDTLKRNGFVPFEEGCRLAESKKKEATWIPSKDCIAMGRELMQKKNKEIILGQHPRLVEGMKKLGMKFQAPKDLPIDKGGFSAAKEGEK